MINQLLSDELNLTIVLLFKEGILPIQIVQRKKY